MTPRLPPNLRKGLLSLALLTHVTAIFLASTYSSTRNPILGSLHGPLGDYLEIFYLNHGYGFFSPNPSSSILMQVKTYTAAGTSELYWYPDREMAWPSLRFRRYLMLPEKNLKGEPRQMPDLLRSYLLHACHEHADAKKVELFRIIHRSMTPAEARRGVMEDDPVLFTNRQQIGGLDCAR